MHPYRAFIVDDYRDTADTLATVLRAWGYEVRVAYDAPSVLADVDVFNPDVVLSDIAMPGMSGFSLAEKLSRKNVLLVATTDMATHRIVYELSSVVFSTTSLSRSTWRRCMHCWKSTEGCRC